jgi:linoleoyl-CoA desaturase
MAELGSIYFNNDDANQKEFAKVLNSRVNDYFKTKGISKFGNLEMYVKTVFMICLFFVPFTLLLVFEPSGWLAIGLSALVGFGMAGIGLGVMHDAIHGAYSKHKWVNKFFGYTLNLVGGHAINWEIQHNIKHHSYTNIEDVDEDVEPKAILRLHPSSTLKPVHKYQYLYAWVFYALGTFFWVTFKDFAKINRYRKEGILAKNTTSVLKEYLILIGTKLFYFSYIIGLPLLLTSYTGGEIFIGFMSLHLAAGIGLAVIFQPSHLMSEVEFLAPDKDGKMKYSRLIHQFHTTVNFANGNRFVTWYGGGLNFQLEHHLFPHICHVHYHALGPIVKQTAEEFGVPYYAKKGFFEALNAHNKMLVWLGTPESDLAAAS